jgi:hypothetical protein
MRRDDQVRLRHMLDEAEEAMSLAVTIASPRRHPLHPSDPQIPQMLAGTQNRFGCGSLCRWPRASPGRRGLTLRPLPQSGDGGTTTVCRHFLRDRCHG